MRKATPDTTSISAIIGKNLQDWRNDANVRQDEMARAARERGLQWTSATVAAIETGRRNVSLEEFIALPFICNDEKFPYVSKGRYRRLSGFLVETDQGSALKIGEDGFIKTDDARTLVSGGAVGGEGISVDALSFPKARRERAERIDAEFDAEIKAARRLGIDELEITAAARRLWGRTLTDERDRRVSQVASDKDPRTIQAIRGHVTRALVNELRGTLKTRQKMRRQ